EQRGDLAALKSYDLLFVQFRRSDLGSIVRFDETFIKKVLKHGTNGRELACFGALVAGEAFLMETIIGEIAQKDLYVRIGDGLKIFERDIADFLAAEFFPRKKIKENTQVVDVIQAGERTRPLLNAAQKILTEVGKFLEKRVDLIQVFQIALTIVIGAVHRHVCHTDIIPQKKKYVNFTNSWARENQKNNRGKLQNEHSK